MKPLAGVESAEMAQPNKRDTSLERIANGCALVVMALSGAVIIGWSAGIAPLTKVLPQLPPLPFNVAAGFLLCGAGLWFRRIAAVRITAGVLATLLGVLTVAQDLFGLTLGIDRLFFLHLPDNSGFVRMSPATSIGFVLCGAALALFHHRLFVLYWAVQVCALAAGTIGAAGLLYYILGADFLYQVPGFGSFALLSAVGFVLLACGVLAALNARAAAPAGWRGTGPVWLGFGVLTVLLLTLGLVSAVRLNSLAADFDAQAAVATPRVSVAEELESTVVGYGLNIRVLLAGEAAARADVEQSAAAIEQLIAEYQRLAQTPRQLEMATRFTDLWQQLLRLGNRFSLTGRAAAPDLAQFSILSKRIEALLDDDIQADALAAVDARRENIRAYLGSSQRLTDLLLIAFIFLALATSAAVTYAVQRGEGALRESEERLRLANERFIATLQASPVVVFHQDRALRYHWIENPGPGLEPERIIGRTDEDIFERAEDARRIGAIKREVLRNGQPRREEVCAFSRGAERWYDLHVRPHRAADGSIIGVLCTAVDITDRKRVQEEFAMLADERARRVGELEALLQALPVGVFISRDPLCENIEMNDAAAALLRMPRNANASKTGPQPGALPFRLMKNGVEVAGADLPMQLASRTARPVIGEEVDMVFGDGDVVSLYEHAIPLFDTEGKVRGCVGVFIDITERKAGEDRLRASEERFRSIFEQTPVSIWEEDFTAVKVYIEELRAQGVQDFAAYFSSHPDAVRRAAGLIKVLNVNAASVDLFAARSKKELLASALRTFTPELFGAVGEALASLAGGGSTVRAEVPIVTLSGARREVLLSVVFPRADAALGSVLVTFADITDRKRAEQQLREADRRKDEFLATLAHELRNPLAPLRTGLQLLNLAPGEPSERSVREMMQRQLAQMVRLIDDLLDVSRISRGKIELRKERMELASILQAAVETSRPQIDARTHELLMHLPDEPVFLDADPVRLSQVFSNLLDNAAKYTEPGGRIEVNARLDRGEVVVCVKDTGIGIARENMPKLFELFSQVRGAGAHSQGGLGIGLSLVKGLVRMHGGSVTVQSDGPGSGTEFMVRLPAAEEPEPARVEPPAQVPAAASGGRRILVVDDNRDAASSLTMLLELLGNKVRCAYDGEDAVHAAAEFRPDASLLDIGLPRMNGYEACRRIRAQRPGKDIPIIAITGWGQDEDRRRSREAGFDRHLTKPVDPEALMTLLAGLQASRSPSPH